MRDLLARLNRHGPGAVAAYRADGSAVSAQELQCQAERVAAALPGGSRRVGVQAGNTIETLAAIHGVWQSGASAAVISRLVPEEEMRRRLGEIRADALVVPGPSGPVVDELAGSRDCDGDEALVMFTSGTTGRPKAASMTFSAIGAAVTALASGRDLPEEGRPLADPARPPNVVFTSLAHMGGFVGSLAAWYIGKPLLPVDKFSVALAFDIDRRFRVSSFGLTPAMLYDLAYHPEPVRFEHLRNVTVGTAPLPESTRIDFEDRFGVPVLRNYGQTEFGSIAMERLPDVQAGRRPVGSTGRAAPGVEIRISDLDGAALPCGEIGEVQVRGTSAMSGYLGADGRAVGVGRAAWLPTGDLGFLDRDGFLTLVGRARDVIICGGFNIYPAMVEAALNRLPAVRDSAVAGAADHRLGEIPVAAVVLKEGAVLTLDSAQTALRRELTAFEVPRALRAIPTIPRLPTGKVDRPAVAGLFSSQVQ
jgi:fatty-acyl-CoA synthase/O-succinylbenzoic acid--CoA ligase